MKVNRDEQLKTILFRLEQLGLKANTEEKAALEEFGEESSQYIEKKAYNDGVFSAYAIVRKVLDGDYE